METTHRTINTKTTPTRTAFLGLIFLVIFGIVE